MMRSLGRDLENLGPTTFTAPRLARHPDLFAERGALFYTPTRVLPPHFVSSGRLDVTLPAPVPNWLEYAESRAYRVPRFWVDLLQRATGMVRWRPVRRANITFVSFDSYVHGPHVLYKALLDALKVSTVVRRDGRRTYYFGAIVDDNQAGVGTLNCYECIVSHPSQARCRVVVEEASSGGACTAQWRIVSESEASAV